MNLELLFSTFIFSNCLKEMLTFLTISELLRMSVYQGWCCSKSIVVLFPQYLPICSEIGSQVENRKKWKVFEKPAILPLIMMQHLEEEKNGAVFQGNHDGLNLFWIAFDYIGEKSIWSYKMCILFELLLYYVA